MSDDETRTNREAPESAEERRSRQSAREVAEWEHALSAGRADGNSAAPADRDRAKAGAVVSRAHRAEKAIVGPRQR